MLKYTVLFALLLAFCGALYAQEYSEIVDDSSFSAFCSSFPDSAICSDDDEDELTDSMRSFAQSEFCKRYPDSRGCGGRRDDEDELTDTMKTWLLSDFCKRYPDSRVCGGRRDDEETDAEFILQYLAKRLRRGGDDEAESDQSAGATMRVTSRLNVRAGPCTNERIVTTLNAGATVTFTGTRRSGCGHNWLQIRGSFGTGFAASNWLQTVSSGGSTPAPTPSPSGGDISLAQLRSLMPLLSESKAREYLPFLNSAMREGNINTCLRRSAFLAQLAHESGQLRWFEEFASGAAYEGRRDLGNVHPGDGVRYKGRGPIQLTGRANYRSAGQALGVNLEGNPTLAATPQVGFRIAVWFWNTRGLSSFADQGTQAAFDTITRRINGGTNGKADRDQYWRKMRGLLGC